MLVGVKELDCHADLASVAVKFHGTVNMVFLNMSRHVSMTHTCHNNCTISMNCDYVLGQIMSHAHMTG